MNIFLKCYDHPAIIYLKFRIMQYIEIVPLLFLNVCNLRRRQIRSNILAQYLMSLFWICNMRHDDDMQTVTPLMYILSVYKQYTKTHIAFYINDFIFILKTMSERKNLSCRICKSNFKFCNLNFIIITINVKYYL